MSHTYENPSLPLGSGEKVISGKQVLASGEGNYFDFVQHHDHNDGSGINHVYPSPSDIGTSGVIETRGPDDYDTNKPSGILHWAGLRQSQNLSNSPNSAPEIPEITFYPYIHYLPDDPDHDEPENKVEKRQPIKIPYLSDVDRSPSEIQPPYAFGADGLFSVYQMLSPYTKGYCSFADGTCSAGYTFEECTAHPGASYSEEPCGEN